MQTTTEELSLLDTWYLVRQNFATPKMYIFRKRGQPVEKHNNLMSACLFHDYLEQCSS